MLHVFVLGILKYTCFRLFFGGEHLYISSRDHLSGQLEMDFLTFFLVALRRIVFLYFFFSIKGQQ